MPTRINDYTALFTAGEKAEPELAWGSGRGTISSNLYYSDPREEDPSHKDSECNFWLREHPWRLDENGCLTHDSYVGCRKDILDKFFEPKFNEYGEVSP